MGDWTREGGREQEQGADSRHVRNQTLPANGQVVDGKRGPVKRWKKLGGLKHNYAQVYPLDERYVPLSRRKLELMM
jgi:hypothetical protein